MSNGPEGFDGPREVWRNPTLEEVDKDLKYYIEMARGIIQTHEPIVVEQLNAFVNLGERIREAEETREDIRRLQGEKDRDQEEVNATTKGARKTIEELMRVIAKAASELGIDT